VLAVVLPDPGQVLLQLGLLEQPAGEQGLGLGFHDPAQRAFRGEGVAREGDGADGRLHAFHDAETHLDGVVLAARLQAAGPGGFGEALFQVKGGDGIGVGVDLGLGHQVALLDEHLFQDIVAAQLAVALQDDVRHGGLLLDDELHDAPRPAFGRQRVGLDGLEVVQGVELLLDFPEQLQVEIPAQVGLDQGGELVEGHADQPLEAEVPDRLADVPFLLRRGGQCAEQQDAGQNLSHRAPQ